MSKNNISPLGKEKLMDYSVIISQLKFLQGRILTIVDASYQSVQCKAVKDLINSVFSQQMSWIAQLCFPEQRITTREALEAEGIDVQTIERGASPDELQVPLGAKK